MRNIPIQLNRVQIAETVNIFASAASEADRHARKIRLTGRNLLTLLGIEVTLGMAIKRRRHCINVIKRALRGFIL